jgi:hypothetical protein
MFTVIFVVAVFLGLHHVLHIPTVLALAIAAVIWVVFWILWKLKYIILGILGIEWLIDRKDS